MLPMLLAWGSSGLLLLGLRLDLEQLLMSPAAPTWLRLRRDSFLG